MQNRIPYCYLIGWTKLNKWYFGCKFGKNAHPKYLFDHKSNNGYFTSSKIVKQFIEFYGYPDVIQIRKTFNSVEYARYYEGKILKLLKAASKDKWLNMSDSKSIPPRYGINNPSSRQEIKDKISIANKGKFKGVPLIIKLGSQEKVDAMMNKMKHTKSQRTYNHSHTDKAKANISIGRQKFLHSPDGIKYLNNMSELCKIKFAGEGNPAYGKIWITDGVHNKRIEKHKLIPIGWNPGITRHKK